MSNDVEDECEVKVKYILPRGGCHVLCLMSRSGMTPSSLGMSPPGVVVLGHEGSLDTAPPPGAHFASCWQAICQLFCPTGGSNR